MDVDTTDLLHELLERTFAELGATGPMIRTILLGDRQFAGQKFRCGGLQAVWLVDGDEIAFYEDGGALLKTIGLKEMRKNNAA